MGLLLSERHSCTEKPVKTITWIMAARTHEALRGPKNILTYCPLNNLTQEMSSIDKRHAHTFALLTASIFLIFLN